MKIVRRIVLALVTGVVVLYVIGRFGNGAIPPLMALAFVALAAGLVVWLDISASRRAQQ